MFLEVEINFKVRCETVGGSLDLQSSGVARQVKRPHYPRNLAVSYRTATPLVAAVTAFMFAPMSVPSVAAL